MATRIPAPTNQGVRQPLVARINPAESGRMASAMGKPPAVRAIIRPRFFSKYRPAVLKPMCPKSPWPPSRANRKPGMSNSQWGATAMIMHPAARIETARMVMRLRDHLSAKGPSLRSRIAEASVARL
ncbi:hypothetical protein GCM10007071_21970 [Marinobacter zhanjiangensis]|uniref:Uncharacterized protein n=1 Tax=Marinobacter zhanjiangensis TaxID=578215 RepID=A0ABQ3B320_9GAMM|nr:hypothetical protein GCM10007071_21970 [Marinobacter zhanjiangensis]